MKNHKIRVGKESRESLGSWLCLYRLSGKAFQGRWHSRSSLNTVGRRCSDCWGPFGAFLERPPPPLRSALAPLWSAKVAFQAHFLSSFTVVNLPPRWKLCTTCDLEHVAPGLLETKEWCCERLWQRPVMQRQSAGGWCGSWPLPSSSFKNALPTPFRELGIFRVWAAAVFAWVGDKPFSSLNSDVPSVWPRWVPGRLPGRLSSQESACNAADEFDPRVGKIPWGRHGDPLQCSRLENPTDRGAWRAADHASWTPKVPDTPEAAERTRTCVGKVSAHQRCWRDAAGLSAPRPQAWPAPGTQGGPRAGAWPAGASKPRGGEEPSRSCSGVWRVSRVRRGSPGRLRLSANLLWSPICICAAMAQRRRAVGSRAGGVRRLGCSGGEASQGGRLQTVDKV